MSRITTTFTFETTADDVMKGVDLRGKRAIVTGGASGIGTETTRALAAAGASVTVAVRDVDAGNAVATQIASSTGNSSVEARQLDLADLDSVSAFVREWDAPLDLLILNAGVMRTPEQRTQDGWELQFATNYLGHFALALGLHDSLAATGWDREARIVVVSSSGHLFSPVVFDDLNFEFRPYDPLLAYGQSKTACISFAVAATELWSGGGITANALNPGAIATNLQRHVGGKLLTPPEKQKTIQQGAATTLFVATSPLLNGIGGRYFEDCNEAPVMTSRNEAATGVASYALDRDNAKRLWKLSEAAVNQEP